MNSAIPRMLDANTNRAREALRVMEDAARFGLNDASLAGELKSLRHSLREALASVPAGLLEAHRDTPGDVGTTISTDAERSRDSLSEVVIAAGKRLGEALRVIEEASKVIDPDIAAIVKSLRYRAYDFEQRLTMRMGSGRARQWRLCLLLTRSLCTRPWKEVLAAAVGAGVDCVQVREKTMDGGELAGHVREVIDIVRQKNVVVIVNDRADVALACGADGVHLGQNDLSVRDVRRIAGCRLIVGVSTHDMNEAEQAVADGADYCGVGAMFASRTKQRETSGTAYLKQFVERYPNVPHLAIGGITPANVGEVIAGGAKGIAVSSAICGADDPHAATASIGEALEQDPRETKCGSRVPPPSAPR